MSIRIFRQYIQRNSDGSLDASQVISMECYHAFLTAKGAKDCEEEAKKFYRVLTTHLSGVDGRKSFRPEEEEAILNVLRRNEPWPCFPTNVHYGTGFRGRGFHEKQSLLATSENGQAIKRMKPTEADPPLLTPPSAPPPMPPVTWAIPPTATLPILWVGDSNPVAGQSLVSFSQFHVPVPFRVEEPNEELFVHGLATHVAQFGASFSTFGIDVLASVIGTLGFVLKARLLPPLREMKPATKEMGLALTQRLTEEDSNAAVHVWDMLNGSGNRIVAQNELARVYFGNRVNPPKPEEIKFNPIQREEMYFVAKTVAESYLRPGEPVELRMPMMTASNQMREFFIIYRVDRNTLLLTAKMKPML